MTVQRTELKCKEQWLGVPVGCVANITHRASYFEIAHCKKTVPFAVLLPVVVVQLPRTCQRYLVFSKRRRLEVPDLKRQLKGPRVETLGDD